MRDHAERVGPFLGIPKSGVEFLRELALHNDRDWFRQHEDWYRKDIEAPTATLAVELGRAVRRFAPSAVAIPRIGGSLFRIQRDMRFAEGAPYKTHVGLRIRHATASNGARCEGPVMYLEFTSEHLLLAVGEKEFDAGSRTRWLELLQGNASAVLSAVATADSKRHDVLGPKLKRSPIQHPDPIVLELARRKGVFVQKVAPLPRSLHGPSFVDHCIDFYSAYGSLFETLGRLHRL